MQPGNGPQVGLFTINNRKFPLYEGVNTIGRNREAVVNIKHVIISQHHALITILNGEFFISDLKSSNGSFLDGMRLLPLIIYPLKNDAKITLGNLHGTLTITSNPLFGEPLVETQTQSFFDGGTQLLESTEEVTQKIFWPPSVPRRLPGPIIGEIHDEHLSVLENFVETARDPRLETVEDLPSSPVVNSDDEATDCEENAGPSGENDGNKDEATFCDKSSESLEFLNKSLAMAQPNGEESRSSSDEDSFAFKRTRKSFMVISTQDLQGNVSEHCSQQLEETIPATQYPSALELDESDIIAATQAWRPDTQNSESEVFKLGLTPLMDSSLNTFSSPAEEPAQEENESIDTTHVGPTQTVQNNEDIHEAATQKVASTPDETFNIFEAPTQKLCTAGDSFLQPTQPMLFSEALEDVDYDSPTQKVFGDDDTFLAPTQKLSLSAAAPEENEDLYLAPTQRVLLPKRVYSFKKTKCNLDASLSVLAVGEVETGQAKPDSAAMEKKNDVEVIAQPHEEIFMETPTGDFSMLQDAEDAEVLQANQVTSTGAQSEDFSNSNGEVKLQENKSENHPNILEFLNSEDIEGRPEQALEAGENVCNKPQLPNVSNSYVETKSDEPTKFSEETVDRTSRREQPANCLNPFIIEDAEERSVGTFKRPQGHAVASDSDHETVGSTCKNFQINGEISLAANIEEPAKLEPNFASEDTFEKLHKSPSRQCGGKTPKKAKSGSSGNHLHSLIIEEGLNCDESDSAASHANEKTGPRTLKRSARVKAGTIPTDTSEEPEKSEVCEKPPKRPLRQCRGKASKTPKTEDAVNPLNPFINEDCEERRAQPLRSTESDSSALDTKRKTVARRNNNCKTLSIEPKSEEPANSAHCFTSEDTEEPVVKPPKMRRQCRSKPSEEVKSEDKPKETAALDEAVEETRREEMSNTIRIDQSMALLAPKMVKTKKSTKTEEIQINFPKERKSMELSVEEKEKPTRGRRAAAEGKRPKSPKHKEGPQSKKGVGKVAKRANKEPEADEESQVKKLKLQAADTPVASPRENLRKQRHKVVFTMLNSPQLESLIKQLGGSIVDSVESCTVLITEHVKRSQKLLEAIGKGRPICSPQWILDSKRAKQFLDPWDYILTDPEAEKNWEFSLNESLRRGRAQNLLKDYNFSIQVTNGVDVLKGGIKACGGKCLARIPAGPLEHAYVISTVENRTKHNKILQKHPHFQAIEAEALFDAVLRQEVRFFRHKID